MKRHTCIICGAKRYEQHMENVFKHSWACSIPKYYFQSSLCCEHIEIKKAIEVINTVRSFEVIRWSHLK